MLMNYWQTISKASQAEKTEIFEGVFAYLVDSPNFEAMSIKEIEQWNQSAPYNLLAHSAKRFVRESKADYITKVNSNIAYQIDYILSVTK